ncbi:MAG: CAP domain-containing protein [Anaerolineales bacterium]
MRPRSTLKLTLGSRLALALGGVCSVAALLAGWVSVPGVGFTAPSLITSADGAGLSASSNSPQTSVTEGSPPVLLPSGPEGAGAAEGAAFSASAAAKATSLVDQMNRARADAGTQRLSRSPALDAVALSRALDLLRLGYFDHYGPDGESAFTELRSRGIRYRLAGENLARNNYPDAMTVNQAFEALMASPGHHANIVEPRFASVGVAAVLVGERWLYVTVFTN